MRGYCQSAIDRELAKDEAGGMDGLLADKPDHELFAELQREIFGDKILGGNSADLIREVRGIRDARWRGGCEWDMSSSMRAWPLSGW